MPRYDYECFLCEHRQEIVCRIADRPERLPCPSCPAGMMRQVIGSAPAIQCDDIVGIPWLREFSHAHTRFAGSKKERSRDGGAPIKTRTEYKQYLKRNDLRPDAPGISQAH